MARRTIALAVERPVVALCAGKDCRSRCEFSTTRDALQAHCDVVEMRCVGICKGPIVVAHLDSAEPVVLARVRSKKQRKRLVAVATGASDVGGSIESLHVRGKKRRSTVRRARAAIAEAG